MKSSTDLHTLADASYEFAIKTARELALNLPMPAK